MKFNWKDDDQKYIKLGLTAFAVVVLSILANQVLHQIPLLTVGVKTLLGCLKPIAYGLVFAYLLTPLLNMFERWLFRLKFFDKGNTKSFRLVRGISVVLAWGVMICVVAVLIKLVVPEILSSIQGIIDNMPVYIITLRRWVSRLLEGNPDIRDWIMTQIGKFYTDFTSVAGSFPEFVDKISKFMPRVGSFAASVSSGVFSAVTGTFNIVVGVIVSIYVMAAKENFVAQAKKFTYALLPTSQANSLSRTVRLAHIKFGGFFVGKIIDSAIIGVLCFVLLSIFRIPYAMLLSFIVGVTNIIPFFGPFIGAVPGAIILILANPLRCLYFLIIIVALQQIDGNIIGPKILSNSIGISSFWVMFSILVFGGLFGFWGLVCGVPLFAVLYDLISGAVNVHLKKKGLPVQTRDYHDLGYVDTETGEIISRKDKDGSNDSEGR